MERFISACRNPLAKSATTKAISHCDPSAECEVALFPCGIKVQRLLLNGQIGGENSLMYLEFALICLIFAFFLIK